MNLGERTRKLHDSTTKKDEESMKAGFHGYKSYPEMDKEYSSLYILFLILHLLNL